MKGKAALLASAAVVALVASAGVAQAAAQKKSADLTNNTSPTLYINNVNADDGDAGGLTLEERVRRLEEKYQSDHSRLSTIEQNAQYTSWTFDNARPVVSSGDGRFSLAFRVRFQFDTVNFFQNSDVNTVTATKNVAFKDLSSGSVVRRAFFGVEGRAFKDFWYEFRYNAGGSDGGSTGVSGVPTGTEGDGVLSLARIAYLGIPNFMVNVGVIEPAFMYEGTTSSGQIMFFERPEIDNIAADSFGSGDARRGVEVRFQKADFLMPGDNFVLGTAFTGNKTGSAASHGNLGDEQTQWLVHGSYRLWNDGPSNLIVGGDYSHTFTGGISGGGGGATRLRDRPEFRVDGNRLIDTGAINGKSANMYAFNAGANIDNFYLGGEYAHFEADRQASGALAADNPEFNGWYVEGSWVLTGEPKSYTVSSTNNEVGGFGAPRPASPFSLDGDSWGAWELTARYSVTDLNWEENRVAGAGLQAGIAGGEERVMLIGMNWYLNQNIKAVVNYAFVDVDKLSAAGSAVQTGQDLNILGVRLQFSN